MIQIKRNYLVFLSSWFTLSINSQRKIYRPSKHGVSYGSNEFNFLQPLEIIKLQQNMVFAYTIESIVNIDFKIGYQIFDMFTIP